MNNLKYYAGGNRHAKQDEAFLDSLSNRMWVAGDSDEWDTCWYTGMPKPKFFKDLSHRQNINHIPGNNSLTIKSNLHQTLSFARESQVGDQKKERYGFFPNIFDMPKDYHKFQKFAASNPVENWILKPKNSSRGRGIEVVTDILDVPSGPKWMVQKYLSNPDLIDGRKYVLRLYVLITSIDPLQVYLYREGLVKLASEPFSLDELDNPYAHLTNPDINALNEKAEAPVVFYSLEHYRNLLALRGKDSDVLFQKIRDLVTLTIIASREKFRSRIESAKINQHACYELLGLDCMIDADLKPWILECNLSPSLETCTTEGKEAEVEAVIKTTMVKDMVALRALNDLDNRPSPSDFKNKTAFIKANLDYENAHCGGFERVYPADHTVQDYVDFFLPLQSDLVAAKIVRPSFSTPIKYAHSMTPHLVTDKNMLAIYDSKRQKFIELSAHEGWIWANLMTGHSVEETQQEYLNAFTQGTDALDVEALDGLKAFVWDCAARWVEKGYCKFHSVAEGEAVETDNPDLAHIPKSTKYTLALRFRGQDFQILCSDEGVAELIKQEYTGQRPSISKDIYAVKGEAETIKIDIVRCEGGFHIIKAGQISQRLIKGGILSALNHHIVQSVLNEEYKVGFIANAALGSETDTVQIITNSPSKTLGSKVIRAALFVNFQTHEIEVDALPLPKKSAVVFSDQFGLNIAENLNFAELDGECGELISFTDPVKVMNWALKNGISSTGKLTINQIETLADIL